MTADRIAQLKRQGWWNVGIGFAIWTLIVVMPATLMPILYGPIIDETGWSRGQVTAFSSFKFGVGAALAFFLGHIIDRVGLRQVMLVGLGGTGVAIASLLFVDSLWAYYAAAALLGGSILCCITSIKVLISRWFSGRLGFAIGLALTGAGIAGLVVPMAATALNQAFGWRMTAGIMSLTIFLFLIPLYLLRARETPHEGFTAEMLDPAPGGGTAQVPPGPEFNSLLTTRAFWIVAFAHVIVGAVDHAMVDHLPLFLDRDAHLGPTLAAVGFTVMIVAGALGKLGFGWLFDRFSIKSVALCWASMAVGILLAFPVSGLTTFVAFTLARGASHGGVLVDVPICAKHLFGLRSLSKTIAIFGAANSLGGAIGTGAVGFAHDAMGSYHVSFIVLIALSLLAAAMVWRLQPIYWARYAQRQQTKPLAVPVPASER